MLSAVSAMYTGLMPNRSRAKNHAALVAPPHGKCEHAEEPLDTTWSPGVVRLQDDLRIPLGRSIASGREFFVQLLEVVDAAIEEECPAQVPDQPSAVLRSVRGSWKD